MDTRQVYIDALERLKSGKPTHQELQGKDYKINAKTIALEANKSRNPLYHTHKDILNMIEEVKLSDKEKKYHKKEDTIQALKAKIKQLEEDNKKLLSINAIYLVK
jgi:hypothetical protein